MPERKEPNPLKETPNQGLFPLDEAAIAGVQEAFTGRSENANFDLRTSQIDLVNRNEFLLEVIAQRIMDIADERGKEHSAIFSTGAAVCYASIFFTAKSRGLQMPIVEVADFAGLLEWKKKYKVPEKGTNPSNDVINHMTDLITANMRDSEKPLVEAIEAMLLPNIVDLPRANVRAVQNLVFMGATTMYEPVYAAAQRLGLAPKK